MTLPTKSRITRRQFGWNALGFGTTALLGAEVATLTRRARAQSQQQYAHATQVSITGANALQAHASAHGLLYGAAIDPELLDLDGIAAGHTTDAYTRLFADQTGILVAENAMKWHAIHPAPDRFNFSE